MTNKILISASILAVIAAFPAFAATEANPEQSTGAKIEKSIEKAGDSIEKTADKAGEAVEDAYSDVKAYFSDENDVKSVSSVNVMERMTADELIGTSVQDPKGKEIGKIEDILITADGDAETVIINDGGALGLGGKLAAFDFDVIEGFSRDKDIVVKLNEESLKTAKRFEYKAPAKADVGTVIMPADQYSVAKIVDAKIIDPKNKTVADVDTVSFEGDDADYLIVTFNQVLGMGGDKAALNFDALDLIAKDGKYNFKLNPQQTAQFENFKASTQAN